MVEEVYGNYSPIIIMGRALEFKVSDSMQHESWKILNFKKIFSNSGLKLLLSLNLKDKRLNSLDFRNGIFL
jgi:hypothetical protein